MSRSHFQLKKLLWHWLSFCRVFPLDQYFYLGY